MSHTLARIALIVGGITIFGANPILATNTTDFTGEIQEWCEQYGITWNTQGPMTVARTMFADDAVFISPNGPSVTGRESVVKLWQALADAQSIEDCAVQDSYPEGNGVWSLGETTVAGNPGAHVHWLNFLVHQDGEWKVKLLAVTSIDH